MIVGGALRAGVQVSIDGRRWFGRAGRELGVDQRG